MPHKQIGEYPANWKEIAEQCKTAAGWRCVRCNHPHDIESGHMLTVHHLDGNKCNCNWWNIVALCQRCHLSIQSRVVMDRVWLMPHSEWFKLYVAGYYAYEHGLLHDRGSVENNIDYLIGIGQGTIKYKPYRVQLKRVKGWRMPANTVKVDRATRWGNPCGIGRRTPRGVIQTNADAAAEYRHWLLQRREIGDVRRLQLIDAVRAELRGKNLACWCKPDEPCHADVLLEIANS
jgi:hypothetical protein